VASPPRRAVRLTPEAARPCGAAAPGRALAPAEEPVYGISTGFGALAATRVPPQRRRLSDAPIPRAAGEAAGPRRGAGPGPERLRIRSDAVYRLLAVSCSTRRGCRRMASPASGVTGRFACAGRRTPPPARSRSGDSTSGQLTSQAVRTSGGPRPTIADDESLAVRPPGGSACFVISTIDNATPLPPGARLSQGHRLEGPDRERERLRHQRDASVRRTSFSGHHQQRLRPAANDTSGTINHLLTSVPAAT